MLLSSHEEWFREFRSLGSWTSLGTVPCHVGLSTGWRWLSSVQARRYPGWKPSSLCGLIVVGHPITAAEGYSPEVSHPVQPTLGGQECARA